MASDVRDIAQVWTVSSPDNKEWALKGLLLDKPHDARLWCCLGIHLRRTDRLSESESALKQAVKIDPLMKKAWEELGLVYHRLRRPLDSNRAWDTALEIMVNGSDDYVIC